MFTLIKDIHDASRNLMTVLPYLHVPGLQLADAPVTPQVLPSHSHHCHCGDYLVTVVLVLKNSCRYSFPLFCVFGSLYSLQLYRNCSYKTHMCSSDKVIIVSLHSGFKLLTLVLYARIIIMDAQKWRIYVCSNQPYPGIFNLFLTEKSIK